MEQIQKLKAELEQVQKELRAVCNKAWNKNHFNNYYVPEISKLVRRKTNLHIKINQLGERLSPDYRRIWVQGSNSGRTKFCFTIFPNRGEYTMRFLDAGSFRQFRTDGNLDEEMEIIERFIDSLSDGILNDVII